MHLIYIHGAFTAVDLFTYLFIYLFSVYTLAFVTCLFIYIQVHTRAVLGSLLNGTSEYARETSQTGFHSSLSFTLTQHWEKRKGNGNNVTEKLLTSFEVVRMSMT